MSNTNFIRARDVMKDHFIEIDGKMTVKDAIDVMQEQGATTIIVKKRNDDDEYGIVLLSDIAKRVLAKDRSPERVNIYEVMSKPIIGVAPEMGVRHCARLFERFGLSVAPVIADKKIIGMVGYTELVLNGLVKLGD